MRFSVFVLVLLLYSGVSSVLAANVLVIHTTGKPPLNTSEQSGFMDMVTSEALRRMGYQLQTVQLPAERGLANSNAGIDDGEMSRISGLEKLYPNLIRVPEKIMDWEFNVFTDKNINFHGKWSDLSPYAVSYINGWKILEHNVPEQAQVSKVKNTQQLFAMLEKGRTDLVIYERWGGLSLIQKNKLENIHLLSPPLAVRDMYIYLHLKHKQLVPRLARELHQMKQDGTYQKIFDKTLAPLMQN